MGLCSSVACKEGVIVKLYAARTDDNPLNCNSPPEQFSTEILDSDLLMSSDEKRDAKGVVEQVNLALVNCYQASGFNALKIIEKIMDTLLIISIIGVITTLVVGAIYNIKDYRNIFLAILISVSVLGRIVTFFLRREKNKRVRKFVVPVLESFNEKNKSKKLKAEFQTRKYQSSGPNIVKRKPAKLEFLRILADV